MDIVSILRNEIGPLPDVVHLAERGFDVPINILDSSLMIGETGWQPSVQLESGVRRTVEWLRARGEK